MKRRPAALIAGALVVLAGCAAASNNTPHWSDAEPDAERTTVRVENQSFDPVKIYVLRGGIALRLGTVQSQGVQEFVLPRAIAQLGETRLLVRPLGSPADFTTETIVFAPGDRIDWQIHNVLRMSAYSVWRPAGR